ncbi:unnamed protein product [Calicophoron daubneyi]|uniref:SAP domain-containing protein n=1 Tax=Calicophoron daubneyi TaxID=300641 RepID=A0AAV2T0N6_CALDB
MAEISAETQPLAAITESSAQNGDSNSPGKVFEPSAGSDEAAPSNHSVSGDEKEEPSSPADGPASESSEKRERRKVQRLSETLSLAHVENAEKRAKIAQEKISKFEEGKGQELGEIPLIEASIRKTAPIALKPLHLMIYGRPGSAHEIRSNLRKFRGFSFAPSSVEYTKKASHLSQRSNSDLRDALRILNLEVSGTREQMASRLMDFLMLPTSAVVKYKGKIVKKSGRGRSKSAHKTPKSERKKTKKSPSSKAASSEISGEEISQSEEEDEESDESISSPSESASVESPKPARKRGRPAGKTNAAPKQPKVQRRDNDNSSKAAAKAKKMEVEDDEDVPLSSLATPSAAVMPSDAELKENIISLLKTVNLEETSLKVVRGKIFARYPGVDLTGKKDFISTTVKEYLSQS